MSIQSLKNQFLKLMRKIIWWIKFKNMVQIKKYNCKFNKLNYKYNSIRNKKMNIFNRLKIHSKINLMISKKNFKILLNKCKRWLISLKK